jgi:hypothetical protein
VCEFYHEDSYIEVEGSFHRLNRVGLEVMDGRAAIHVASQPLLPVSTDSRAWFTLVNQRMNVAIKSQPKPTQNVVGRLRGWAGRLALEPL